MKICLPVISDTGLDASIYDHFGSAPFFAVYDTGDNGLDIVNNNDHDHEHGMCQPIKLLENLNISAVICRGMGLRAVNVLKNGGISVFRTDSPVVRTAIDAYNKGELEELLPGNACSGHGCH